MGNTEGTVPPDADADAVNEPDDFSVGRVLGPSNFWYVNSWKTLFRAFWLTSSQQLPFSQEDFRRKGNGGKGLGKGAGFGSSGHIRPTD
jgi:hypothetical protein